MRVRYRTGDTDEWTLHETTDYDNFLPLLMDTFRTTHIVGIGAAARSGEVLEWSQVAIRMADVVSVEVDGLTDGERMNSWLGASED